jgi:signal peptidase I
LFVLLILFVVSLNLGSRAVGLRAYTIPSAAMIPTLRPGDHFLVDTLAYTNSSPQRGDVVTFVHPAPGASLFVKRVIAVGGDVIEGEDEVVKLNGAVLREPYIAPVDGSEPPPVSFGPITIPPGDFFVIGDARQNSNDSRYFGFVDSKEIRGRVTYILWSKDPSRNWTRVK